MAADQRYCLQCGSRRAHLPGVRDGLGASPADTRQHERLAGASAPGAPPSASPARTANNTISVIAGVGVLLLAMGIGVLIGRANSGSGAKASAAPQVISVATSATGPATTPVPTTTAPSQPAPKSKSKGSSSEVGKSLSKPAPPSAVQNLRSGGSGQSYEQKSKNLPDVVSTG